MAYAKSSNKLGTPVKSESSSQPSTTIASRPFAPSPTIPSSWLAPYEQRWLFVSIFGLIEVIKVWDILAPYFIPHPDPTWSSPFRVRGPWTVAGWTLFEVTVFALVSLLRIPMLSPSPKQLSQLLCLLAVWNVACWFVAEPGAFFMTIHLIGPTALGGEWYWSWWYAARRWREPSHLEGVHKIRLLPYSTATLNPLSLSYCIPPDTPEPLYIPIVFNNSVPDQVSYFIRSLDTGHSEIRTVFGSSLKRSHGVPSQPKLADTDEDDDDGQSEIDPLSALTLHSDHKHLDAANLPSVKPSDSLSLVPPKLAASQSVLFLTVDRPSVVSLKSVLDKRGDRFHITPHHEAIVIECPTGGEFMHKDKGTMIVKPKKAQTAELRCVGDEEVAQFQARGVGALRVGWKKRSKELTTTGVIEGIEDGLEPVDPLALIRRDRVSKTHTVPLRINHDRPGIFTVSLTGVTDSLHNTYTPSGHSTEKTYNVIARPTAKFDCPTPRELFVGKTTALAVNLDGLGPDSLELVYSFQPISGDAVKKTSRISKRTEMITVSAPGTYTLLEINGPCSGRIMEVSTCSVQLLPLPTMNMQTVTLREFGMDIGVSASLELTGVPPFVIEYTEQKDGGQLSKRSTRINGLAGEITLQPEQEGQYTYNFVSLSDGKYPQVKLDVPPIKQSVRPLANVDLFGPRKRKFYPCSGNELQVEFETKGGNPLYLTYLISYNGHVQNTTWHVQPGKQGLFLNVPEQLSDKRGGSGSFAITLFSIKDGTGYVRKLSDLTIEVEVDRKKSSARFAKSEKVVITEGQTTKAALRLTGEAPWEVTYNLDGKSEKRVTMRDPNGRLSFDRKGTYRLTSINDAHCQGVVTQEQAWFEVDFKPRPVVDLQTHPQVRIDGNVHRHQGCCAGEEDQVALRFDGQGPFELGYRYTVDGKTSRSTLKSAQEMGFLHLATEPGRHRYDLIDLKDSNYANNPVSIALEHDVHTRPSVSFVKHGSRPMCLDSPLSGDAKVKLIGQAPFTLDLAVRKPASTKVESYQVIVTANDWTLDLPYHVRDVGRHEVLITRVSDASGCEQDVRDGDVLSTTVEVVESARIVPVTQVADLCVGDTLDFVLQGKAPWTVEYEWLGKKHKITSSASRFSRYAEEKGVFAVKSVALKDNQCKREIHDLERRVHPLPSVKIQEGQQSLREGDNPAIFDVMFTGTPPFSFTYTRSELSGSKWRVVETQTVTDIMESSYTISSSFEGDYQVTSVSDKYCRYPSLSRGREG